MTQLNDALQIAERTGERWLEAELYRHKGWLLTGRGQPDAEHAVGPGHRARSAAAIGGDPVSLEVGRHVLRMALGAAVEAVRSRIVLVAV